MQINSIENEIRYVKNFDVHNISWQGSLDRIAFTLENIKSKWVKPEFEIGIDGIEV